MNTIQKSDKSNIYSLRSFHILMVEDYEFMQQLTSGMLKAFGIGNITICNNGQEARDTLSMMANAPHGKRADIVLTDWLMPGGNGPELIKWIRNHKNDSIRFIPVIMFSAFASEDTVKAARDTGANEALVKPLSGEKLARRILSIIDFPRPFIKSPDFFGPDRRRKRNPYRGADRRKINPNDITVHNE